MPYLPIVPGGDNAKSEFVESFGGLCHRERNADGTGTTRKNGALQFYDEKNLSARDFPALATREKRYTVTTGTTGESGVRVCTDIVDDGTTLWRLCWEMGEAFIPRGEHAYMTDGTIWFSLPIQYDGDGYRHRVKRQIIRMGAYLLIWPEKVWINTAKRTGAIVGWQISVYDPNYGQKEVRLFDKDFEEIFPAYYNETPESPAVGEYRVMQSSNTETPTVTVWNGSAWEDPGAVYTYLYPASFGVEAGDIVKVNGFYDSAGDPYETGRFAFMNNKQYTVAKVDEDGFYLPVGCYPGIYTSYWRWGITVQKANRAPEVGMMEQRNTAESVSVVLCRESGDAYTGVTVSPTAPAEPADKALWMDTGGDTPILKEWSATQEAWAEIPTTYLKISGTGIGEGLSTGDGVFLTGFSDTAYNGSYVLRGAGDDYLVVDGIITSAMSGETVTAARTVPDMDFVVESNNRIWGCKYGTVNGQLVNEIYASKLGDFKNWHVFDGLSTDSYAASRGSGGEWTGAIEYGGLPLFFKENSIEKVYPSASGAHRIVSTQARGVQKGCHRSLAIVNEALFYKAVGGVMVYDGSLPTLISEDLGEYQFLYDAAGGGLDGIYYISMQTVYNEWGDGRLFTYDVNKGVWHREDDTSVRQFLPYGGKMHFVSEKMIRDGLYVNFEYDLVRVGSGTETVDWMAETGAVGYHDSNQKYLSRFLLRMKTEGSVKLYIRYDEGEWLHRDTVYMGGSTKTITMPVPPRRCDHVYLRLVGDADMKLYGMTRYYERGSDMAW